MCLGIRKAILVSLLAYVGLGVLHANQDSLTINNEQFSLSTVDAFGKTHVPRPQYCPPISDKYLLDTFINMALEANEALAKETRQYEQVLDTALQAYQSEINKIEQFKANAPLIPLITDIYDAQIKRAEAKMEELTGQLNEDFNVRTQFSIQLLNRIENIEDVSEDEKQILANLKGLATLHRNYIRSRITDETVEQRYHEMVIDKDRSVVDVYVFEHRSLTLLSNDENVITSAVDFLKSETKTSEVPGGILMNSFTLDRRNNWSQLAWSDEVNKDPSKLTAGSFLLTKLDTRLPNYEADLYKITYVFSREHYHSLGLHERTDYLTAPANTIRNNLYNTALKAAQNKLWKQSTILYKGSAVVKASEYETCPRN